MGVHRRVGVEVSRGSVELSDNFSACGSNWLSPNPPSLQSQCASSSSETC